jgi:hypothetical protein
MNEVNKILIHTTATKLSHGDYPKMLMLDFSKPTAGLSSIMVRMYKKTIVGKVRIYRIHLN